MNRVPSAAVLKAIARASVLPIIVSLGLSVAPAFAQLDHPAPGQPSVPTKKVEPVPQISGGGGEPVQPTPDAPPTKPKRAPIYDEKADAKVQIESAIAKAAKENRRVLIQWGANWCGWCHLLHEVSKKDQAISKELMYEYDVVLVDIGQFDKHMDLAEKYGAKLKDAGVPFLTILDAQGKVLGNHETGNLEWPKDSGKEAGHDPAKVVALLKQYEATPWKADEVFASAVSKASSEHKKVFLHFGAPWCGWCHKLEDWMARPDVSAILAKDFIDCKIDVDRMPGGKQIFESYKKGSEQAGIPWFVFIDPGQVKQGQGGAGGAIITSDASTKEGVASGNIGFPAAPEEIAHFKAMVLKARVGLSDGEIEALAATLAPRAK